MKILVLNCGSSSVKFQLMEMDPERLLCRGIVEKIGSANALLRYRPAKKPEIKEFRQLPEERKQVDEGTKCILCVACYSACPVIQEVNPNFLGPAAIVQAARFNDDSRDEGFAERLAQLDYPDGIWPCESRFECTRVCPRGIKITKTINLTKGKITKFRRLHH